MSQSIESSSRLLWPRYLLVAALALLAILPAIQMWHWVSSSWVPLPYWDEWHTPGSQFESWKRGTLTLAEMFSQHNESRLFFSRLLYFALEQFGGWDVRKELRVVFLGVCALAFLLLHLLRRTPGATPISTLAGWILMTFICFAPVQVENFLYGIEIETFFPGFALLAAAAVNLSRFSFRAKALINTVLAFVATYTFANGMLVWALAWPLPSPNEREPKRRYFLWLAFYFAIGAISVGSYFIGYHRPAYHPPFVSIRQRFFDLIHYIILWSGNYFASDMAGPFVLGICALVPFFVAAGYALWTSWRRGDWRTFYPWLLLGAFAGGTVTVTALGRLGFGVEQALDNRYVAFSRYFYIALFGLCFAICVARIRGLRATPRAVLLTHATWGIIFLALLWGHSFEKFAAVPAQHRKLRRHLLQALEWIEPIPDNPDLVLILPFPEVLRERALFLEKEGVLRLHFVHAPLATAVQRPPPLADGSDGVLEAAEFQPDGTLRVKGWAWLSEQKRRPDCVVIGCEDAAGNFKPLTVLGTGAKRLDLCDREYESEICRAGFDQRFKTTNLPADAVRLAGWVIDRKTQQAWALGSSLPLARPENAQSLGPNDALLSGRAAQSRPRLAFAIRPGE
ncbi:MAG TPA: hypothetical protein VGK72_11530 [Chthoniobacterales bacterium]